MRAPVERLPEVSLPRVTPIALSTNDTLQLFVFVELHVILALLPETTVVGEAEMETVGAGVDVLDVTVNDIPFVDPESLFRIR